MTQRALTRALILNVASLLVGTLAVAATVTEAQPQREHRMTQSATATFAGGCFWCTEGPFEALDGVASVTSGYTGGTKLNPTYQEVSSGSTGHAEAVQIAYDPARVTYQELLDVFWRQIDPTQVDGQFADHGRQYRSAIFYHDDEQRRQAEASKQRLMQSGKFARPIVTEVVPASTFYPAEAYHQDYYKQHPTRYQLYKIGSGRAGFLKRVWGNDAHERRNHP